jgi:Phosphoinositide phospholipase C, Ca2+-dependent
VETISTLRAFQKEDKDMKKSLIVLVATIVALMLIAAFGLIGSLHGRSEANVESEASQCNNWEQLQGASLAKEQGGVGQPVIDRLAKGASYGELMKQWLDDNCMRLNYIQVIGTHNSYHVAPRPALLAAIATFDPSAAASLEYTHEPLNQQLERLGIRQLEFDVFVDHDGGLYAMPLGPILVGDSDPVIEEMLAPGLKVLHLQDVDFETRCLTFVSCLEVVEAWSSGHPDHLPVMILVEAKDEVVQVPSPIPPLTIPVTFGSDALDEIDEAIRSVFTDDQLITPDDVRGERATLEEAVLKDGWPTLNESRGRVMFALANTDQKHDLYIAGHPSLGGRVLFTSSLPGSPEAAFVKIDDPLANADYIMDLVTQGYIVRTRADVDTLESRLNLIERRDSALASGAQFVSTDFPEPDFTDYVVELPGGGVARCNPVLSPPGCESGELELTAP